MGHFPASNQKPPGKNHSKKRSSYLRAKAHQYWTKVAFLSAPDTAAGTETKSQNPCKHWLGTMVRCLPPPPGGKKPEASDAQPSTHLRNRFQNVRNVPGSPSSRFESSEVCRFRQKLLSYLCALMLDPVPDFFIRKTITNLNKPQQTSTSGHPARAHQPGDLR